LAKKTRKSSKKSQTRIDLQFKAEYFLWVDSSNLDGAGWVHTDEIDEELEHLMIHTVGFVINESDHAVTISHSVDYPSEVIQNVAHSPLTIPLCSILERRPITL